MAQPEPYGIGFHFLVFHAEIYMTEGAKYGIPGVSIGISLELEDGNWFSVGNITTDRNGEASIFRGAQDAAANYHFTYRKTGYEDADSEGYYENGTHEIERPLHEIGWEFAGVKEKEIQLAWNAQSEVEKLAMSFISALAVIMAFKVLQGFSMERINPVA